MPPDTTEYQGTNIDKTQYKFILLALGLGLGALAVALVPFPQFELIANIYYSLIGA